MFTRFLRRKNNVWPVDNSPALPGSVSISTEDSFVPLLDADHKILVVTRRGPNGFDLVGNIARTDSLCVDAGTLGAFGERLISVADHVAGQVTDRVERSNHIDGGAS